MRKAVFLVTSLVLSAVGSFCEDKKEEKPGRPTLLVAIPFILKAGETQTNRLRGLNLTNVTELRMGTNAGITATIQKKSTVKPPPNTEASRVGDTELEIVFTVPQTTGESQFEVTASSTNGVSEPFTLIVAPPGMLTDEKEPNNSFRKAQPIEIPVVLRGAIQEPHDVDVLRIQGRKGQRIKCQITAIPNHSPLDSLITLYDNKGHILASNDDSEISRDSILEFTLNNDGPCFIGITDAQDRGSDLHCYICRVE